MALAWMFWTGMRMTVLCFQMQEAYRCFFLFCFVFFNSSKKMLIRFGVYASYRNEPDLICFLHRSLSLQKPVNVLISPCYQLINISIMFQITWKKWKHLKVMEVHITNLLDQCDRINSWSELTIVSSMGLP